MKIKNLYFSPVKSLSFNNVDTLEIIKNIGIKKILDYCRGGLKILIKK